MSRDKRGVVNPVVAGYLQTSPDSSSSGVAIPLDLWVMSVASTLARCGSQPHFFCGSHAGIGPNPAGILRGEHPWSGRVDWEAAPLRGALSCP
jgi:hypothetical protein